MLNDLKSYIYLLVQSPKDFLYSFKYSTKDTVKLTPFNPRSLTIAKELMRGLEKKYHDLKVYLIGSVGLGIGGRGDIDIYITTPIPSFTEQVINLEKQFGEPVKRRNLWVEWVTDYKGFVVELTLTHPQNRVFLDQIRLFNLLKQNKNYLDEYEKIKKGLSGVSVKTYVRTRMEFFNRLLSESGNI